MTENNENPVTNNEGLTLVAVAALVLAILACTWLFLFTNPGLGHTEHRVKRLVERVGYNDLDIGELQDEVYGYDLYKLYNYEPPTCTAPECERWFYGGKWHGRDCHGGMCYNW